MSNECSTIVWKRQFGSMTRKVIAAKLADHADDEGRGIWPSVERIAAQCDTSERTVQRTLADFVKEGLLKVVHEGGKGPLDTRRYDFEMSALKALPVASWGKKTRETSVKNDSVEGAKKGDSVSPLSPAKGDTVSSKGDTDDKKGCHGVTQTTKEPSNNPQSRAGARAGKGSVVNRETWKRRFKKAYRDWPTYVNDSEDAAEKAWFALSEEDREAAAERLLSYVKFVQTELKQTSFCYFSVYLKEKRWQRLPEKAVGPEKPATTATPFSKAWSVQRFADLMRSPYGRMPEPTNWQRELFAKGGPMAERERQSRRAKYGWPHVNLMHEWALSRAHKGVSADPSLEQLESQFVMVANGSGIWVAWKAIHDERGWPWFGSDDQCPDWVAMPVAPGEPSDYLTPDDAVRAALARFETEHATITQKDAAE